MNFKTTYILFGILAVVLGIFIYTLFVGPSSSDSSLWVLPSMHNQASPLPTSDIDRIEIERHRPNEEKIVLIRRGDSWRIIEPRDYHADRMAVEDLLRQIHDARRETHTDVTNNPAQYGLDTPAAVITLKKETEPQRQVTLNVGDASPGEASAVVYVSSSDRPKEIMAVAKRQFDKTLSTLADLRSRQLLSPSTGDIQMFALSERNKNKIVKGPLELKKSGEERWAYVQPPYGDAQDKGANPAGPAGNDKPPDNVDAALTDISNLKIDNAKDFVQDDAKDLGKYNLDPAKNDIFRIEVERVESIDTNEKGEKKKETKKVALLIGIGKKIDKKDQYYAYIDDPQHKDIFAISATSVARLLKLMDKPDALRDRNLVVLGGVRKADAINIQNSWGLLEFRRDAATPPPMPGAMPPQETWKLWRGDKPSAVDAVVMQALIAALTTPNQVEGFVDDPAVKTRLGLDKPDAVVRIWTDGLTTEEKKKDDKKEDKKDKKPEPKDKDKPAFTLSFGDLRENKAAVERKRGDEKSSTVVLIPARVRDMVRAEPLAYLDKQLPPFTGNRFDAMTNVTKLTLTRDGTTYEISRENKPDAAWKIDKPPDFAGRTADRSAIDDILRNLNGLRALKIETDKVPEADKLAQWGLKEPPLKAAVTMMQEGKPKTFTFDFGKETDDKTGVYLRASTQDMIVVAGNNVVGALKRELQDPTVLHFDASKVKEVKLTGWIDLQKQLGKTTPLTLTFKRASSGTGWEVEPKDSFKLAAARLDDFLKNLADLKAVKFVAHKAKPSADQQLETDKGALHVELTVAGDKEPRKLTLTVGKEDGPFGYFAISNQLPGDIFDVRKDLFEKAKAAPAYFSGQ